MVRFMYKPIKFNYHSRGGQKIQWIVIHDTANKGRGANALAHYNYFGGGNRGASAHYFVDDENIVQIIGDDYASWHCGDSQGQGKYLNGATNSNSIGIELCINQDGDYEKAYANLVELTKNLMAKFNVPASRVCRHYDVSRKRCPGTFYANNWQRWKQFQSDITKPIKVKLDLDKDSVGVPVDDCKSEQQVTPNKFISLVKDGAIKGQQEVGVLASITIAQAILESWWGKSGLATKGNNLFGIKASADWKGETITMPTKEFTNGQYVTVNVKFRKYKDWNESVRDHANFFISTPDRRRRYAKLLGAKDYREACVALQASGYATDQQYGNKIRKVIEENKLMQYDKPKADGPVKQIAVLHNGKQLTLSAINYKDENYVRIRDLEKIGIKVDWDNARKLVVLG